LVLVLDRIVDVDVEVIAIVVVNVNVNETRHARTRHARPTIGTYRVVWTSPVRSSARRRKT
jgi:hypothetical protein